MALKSKDYWKERERIYINRQMLTDAERAGEIAKRYRESLDNIQKEIDKNYANYAGKEKIDISEAKKLADRHDVEKFAKKAKKYVKTKDFGKQANEDLRLYNLKMRVSRLELMKYEIGLELAGLAGDVSKYINGNLSKDALAELKRQSGILGETLGPDYKKRIESIVDGSFKATMESQPTFSKRIWYPNEVNELVWRQQMELKKTIDRLLTKSLTMGTNPRVVARELRKQFDSTKYQSDRLMITETAKVQNEVQMASYKVNEFEEYVFIAEPGACKVCASLDDEVFKVKDAESGINAVPMHPNCKCSTAAYFDREAWDKDLKARGL